MLFGKFVPDCIRSSLRGSKLKLNHIMMQYTLYVRLCLVFSMLLRKCVCVRIIKFLLSHAAWANGQPLRIIYPTDSKGRLCGVDSAVR